jgi:hypothetical protein
MFIFLAHGEGWEVAASRAVSDLVKKILKEQNSTTEEAQENGTFELHYTPTNTEKQSFKIPLSKQLKPSNNQQQSNNEEINLQPKNSSINRL